MRAVFMKHSFLLVSLLGHLALCRADAVRLQINGPDGKPVAGAKVRVVESSGGWFDRSSDAPRDLESDAKGALTLDSKRSLAAPADPFGLRNLLTARVMAPGLALGGAPLKAGDNIISLKKATFVEGVVLDEQQKPVAGARLRLASLRAMNKGAKPAFVPFDGELAPEIRSDENGKWRFDFVPEGTTATVEIADARFRRQKFDFDAGQIAPPLFVRRGVTIKGRMLKPDGTPATKVSFYAGDHENQPQTASDGRFEVSGLKPGYITLQIVGSESKLPFIVPRKPLQGLKAGEVRDIGDWKTQKGERVKGRVEDGAGKPIPNAHVWVWGPADGSGQSDKNGNFDFLAEPGAAIYSASAPGFGQKSEHNVPDAKNGVVNLGTIELKRGQKVSGVLRNQNGAPIANAFLRAQQKANRVSEAFTDAKGGFTFDGLEQGTFTVAFSNGKIVSGGTFTVAIGATKPLVVVVEGKSAATAPETESETRVEARVVDDQDRPVAGAQVALRLKMTGGSYRDVTGVSKNDGTLSVGFNGSEDGQLVVTEVFRPGFAAGSNDFKLQNGVWRGTLTLLTRGTFLRGRVVDSAGKPVAGAFVGLSTGTELPVPTGENGDFALPDAPQKGVTLLVSDGARFSTFPVVKAGQIEVSLPDAPPIEDKIALADEILPNARWEWGLLENWDAFGSKRIEAAVLRERANTRNVWSWTWERYLQSLARREPGEFLKREAELRAQNPDESRAQFERCAMLARAGAGDATQKASVKKWLDAEQKQKRTLDSGSVTLVLERAEIAARLNPEDATLWLDYAGQIGDQINNRGENSWDWGRTLARISASAAQDLSQNWPLVAQMQLLHSAMLEDISQNDAKAAKSNWERINALAEDAQNAPPDTSTKVEGFTIKAADILRQAKGTYSQFLSRTDPRAAFDIARELALSGSERAAAMPVIGKNAAKLEQFDIARQALKATFESTLGNTEFGASAAQFALTFDEKFADELFALSYDKSHSDNEGELSWTSVAAYAGARAQKWPGEARILIEREWPKRLANAKKPRENNDWEPGDDAPRNLISAMAHINPRRAIEMTRELPEKGAGRAQALGDVAEVLLGKEEAPQ